MTLPKLNKDQFQKVLLSGILFAILIYIYFQFMLGPLRARMAADTKSIAELQVKVDEAKKQVRLGKNAVERAGTSVATMQSIERMIPPEAAIAWLPPSIAQFFERRGILKVPLKLRATEPVAGAGLERFRYFIWDVTFPPVSSLTAISALSELENDKPLLSIRSIKIDANPDAPENQRINCEFKTLLK